MGDSNITWTTFASRVGYETAPASTASSVIKPFVSAPVSGRRYARLPKSASHGPTQVASSCAAASHPVSVVGSAVTVCEMPNAVDSYCSIRTRLPVCELDRLTKPSTFASGTKCISGSS